MCILKQLWLILSKLSGLEIVYHGCLYFPSGDGENPGGLIDPMDDGVNYSAPSSLPVVNADGGKVGGIVVEPEGGLFPSQGSGAGEQGLQNEVHEVGVVTGGWEHSYEGMRT